MKQAEFEIQKNVPMPDVLRGSGGGNGIYPWAAMEPGDSFFVRANGKRDKAQRNLYVAGLAWSTRHGGKVKFSVRRVPGGLRVWRVK